MIMNSELLLIAEVVAREKGISKEAVVGAMEEAIRVAARRKYGHESTIRAEIDRATGEVRIFREMLVVPDDYEPVQQMESASDGAMGHGGYAADGVLEVEELRATPIKISDARHRKPDVELGEVLSEQLPAIDLGRVAAQSAKQVIVSKVKEIEREQNYSEFKDRVGQIVSGVIEKVERNGIIVRIGGAEAIIYNEFLMRDERLKARQGDRIRALVYEVNKDLKAPQILLSRTHKEFVAELFAQEVPEIYDRIIEIKAIARDPGSRTKIAVFTTDKSIDAIGSCVGMRGSRVQAVINELGGEKIDVIEWSPDAATTIVSALAPAEVSKVVIDEDRGNIEVVVPEAQLSIAIGRRGQNVRLASELVGWNIDVLTEADESSRRTEEFKAITTKFIQALDVDEILAQLLVSEGYSSVQDIADAKIDNIAAVEGMDEAIAEELVNRAREYAASHDDAEHTPSVVMTNGEVVSQEIVDLSGMTNDLAIKLHNVGILTLEELADLSVDEVLEKMNVRNIDRDVVGEVIMAARQKVYFDGAAEQVK